MGVGLLGFLAGLLAGWWLGRAQLGRRVEHLKTERDALAAQLRESEVRRELEGTGAAERLEAMKAMQEKVESTFKALSADALHRNNQQFLELAKQVFGRLQEGARGDLEKRQQAITELVAPLRKSLEQVDEKIQAVERARTSAYAGLQEQIKGMLEGQGALQKETSNLVYALKAPAVRGRWGEIQLERTVEFAGMTEHVDFVQQASTDTAEGRLRPDLIVHLPGGKRIVVDAKAPLAAYLEALEAKDPEVQTGLLQRHARQIRDHIKALGAKQYWRQFDPSPEFVVLFLPGEVFFSAALEQDPDLIQFGSSANVLLATPTTLIALLKATVYGWRQEAVTEQAREISALGRELYERLCTQAEHFADVGKSLQKAVESYNKSLRSLETRVLVTARKFENLANDGGKRLPEIDPVEAVPLDVDTADS